MNKKENLDNEIFEKIKTKIENPKKDDWSQLILMLLLTDNPGEL